MKSTVNYAPFRRVLLIFLGAVLVLFVGLRYYDAWKTARAIREDPRQRTVMEFIDVFNGALGSSGFALTDPREPWFTLSTFHYSRLFTLTLPNGTATQCLLETTQPEERAIVRRVTLSWDAAPDAPYVTVLTEALLDIFEPGFRAEQAYSGHESTTIPVACAACESDEEYDYSFGNVSSTTNASGLSLTSVLIDGVPRKTIVFHLIYIPAYPPYD